MFLELLLSLKCKNISYKMYLIIYGSSEKMSYFVVKESISIIKNTFILIHSNWNDYWEFTTLYDLYFCDKDGNIEFIGEVKIADYELDTNEKTSPQLPDEFDYLSEDFFSLGQSADYYDTIYNNKESYPVDPLVSLCDIANNTNIFDKVSRLRVTRNSLFRDVPRSTVMNQFSRICRGGVKVTDYDFTYIFDIDSRNTSLGKNRMNFEVVVNELPPSNIHVVIGRNGVGKSQLFHNMIDVYLEKEDATAYFEKYSKEVDPGVIFPNLIYMSYSAFDNCKEVNDFNDFDTNKKYTYLGLRKKGKSTDKFLTKDMDDLAEEFSNSFSKCLAIKQKRDLLSSSINILEADPIFKQANFKKFIFSYKKGDLLHTKNELFQLYKNRISSGHGIILLSIVKLIDNLEEKTLVLIDEPETHLHPPLLSAFIRCLSDILFNRNAVAIVATHSPIVLQEVTKKCVWKLDRSGYIMSISRPLKETFGENYNALVEDIFGFEIQKSGFHKLIKDEVEKTKDIDELERNFGYQLGEDADIIARTLFLQKEIEESNED